MSTRSHLLLAVVAGAACLACSSMLVKLSGTAPATAAAYRCGYALPVLGALLWWERRRRVAPTAREVWVALLAGLFLGLDLVLWHAAIAASGAGIATVVVNLQVVFVGLAGWLTGERPPGRVVLTLPAALGGLTLVSGVFGTSATEPLLGTVLGVAAAVAYAGFLLTLRLATPRRGVVIAPLFWVTLSAAVFSVAAAIPAGGLDPPDWPAHGWLVLVALSGQVAGWLLVAVSLPRLPALLTSLILVVQPVAAVLLAAMVLGERFTLAQAMGCAALLAAVGYASGAPWRRSDPAAAGGKQPGLEPAGRLQPVEQGGDPAADRTH